MHSKNYLPHHYLDTQSQNKALVSSRLVQAQIK